LRSAGAKVESLDQGGRLQHVRATQSQVNGVQVADSSLLSINTPVRIVAPL
jgi:hypothetical protein